MPTMMLMREGSAPLIRREDYTAPAYTIGRAELTFDLDAAKTIVASKLSVQRDTAQERQPLRLHGEGLNLLRVMAGGESVAFRHEDGLLVIDNPPAGDSFVLEIRNTCAPEKNSELSGLYTSGNGFFTQCEAEVPATTRDWWRAIGWKRSAAYPAWSKSPANIAIESPCPTRIPWSSRSLSPAKRPIR
jgi:aminopeptidase N